MKIFKKILLPILLVCAMLFSLVACSSGTEDTSAKLDELQQKLEQLQKELQDKYNEDSNAKIEELQQQIEQLQAELQKKCEELAKDEDIDALKEQISQLEAQIAQMKEGKSVADESYEKLKYIDANLRDRDCINGENFEEAQKWIEDLALAAGYTEEEVVYQDFNFTRRNTQYTSQNIVITKTGTSQKQIIVGAHYDGTGTGDNGSGVALALTTAEKFATIETPYTIQFVFFSAEEYGCYGSSAYANAMTEEEVANTLYMINLDSLVCGDYCYIYGGVQNNAEKTVTDTEAYDNAMSIAISLGLDIHSNPWTWENPAPGYSSPEYASPSTGDWSDHRGFKNRGIKYLYMEATNWEIPGPYNEYDGYGETVLVGMLMNTENDYLEYIEHYFPGRIQQHLTQFATLLNALLVQPNVNF